VAGCELEDSIFRTNHASNWLPLKGTLSRDKTRLLKIIDQAFPIRIRRFCAGRVAGAVNKE